MHLKDFTIEKYVQIVNESVMTKGMLNKEEIISIVQAKENDQESSNDKVTFSSSIITKEVYNTMQTVL
ncbi:8620_t:CDS:2 [Cetraspora pellucida]|uniref:8620_t:CDS:1 n=1 Tax=Cetraspora pellucida TaxID=1433469 RepID=A0ACA9KAH3_9GLOM|nr:8620_t:CDS:2 [Cetraspora pellucida]